MTIQAGMLPELEIGVETPWPLKREGKQVYAKLIDFGGFPAPYGLKAKLHEVPDIEWSQISWEHSYVASSTDSRRRSLALVSTPATSGGTMPWRFLVDSNSVQVNMLSMTDYREWDTIVICLLYTKTNNGVECGKMMTPGPAGTVLSSASGEMKWSFPMFTDYEVLTEAYGSYVVPATGWYFVLCVGGGGAGAGGFGSPTFCSGGSGGGSGYVAYKALWLEADQSIPYVVGRGGFKGQRNYNGVGSGPGGDGGATCFEGYIRAEPGTGATGADKATRNTSRQGFGNDDGGKGGYSDGTLVCGQTGGAGFPLAPRHCNGAGGQGGGAANTTAPTVLLDGSAGTPGCILIFKSKTE